MDKPLIWAGSKRSLLDVIRPILLPTLASRKFIEPFAGSAALTFALEPKRFLLADTNPWLINFYQQLAAEPELIASHWAMKRAMHRAHGKDYYDGVRRLTPADLSPFEAAVWFLYLNRTCFNGLWRVNGSGRFNVPIGHLRDIDTARLIEAGQFLRRGMVIGYGFEHSMDCAVAGDVVYLDPPYSPKSATANFSDYTKEGWSAIDDARLADRVADLTSRGVAVILSARDDERIQALYPEPGYCHLRTSAPDRISARVKGRGMRAEALILNYRPSALNALYNSPAWAASAAS